MQSACPCPVGQTRRLCQLAVVSPLRVRLGWRLSGSGFPPEVIVLAVRWYLRFGLSYRDVEEPLAERGVEVDHLTVYRWVRRFAPLLAEAARPWRRGRAGTASVTAGSSTRRM